MAIDPEMSGCVRPEDAELVRAVLGGDRRAYGTLYDRYVRLIEAVCFDYARGVADAQDLCQEAFLLAFQRLDRLRQPDRYAAWMVGVAKGVCRDWRRGRRRAEKRTERLAAQGAAETQSTDDGPWDQEDVRRLHEALLRLPARERLAIQSYYLLGEPASRSMESLGLSSSGLYKLLGRARTRLKQWLQDSGRTSHE